MGDRRSEICTNKAVVILKFQEYGFFHRQLYRKSQIWWLKFLLPFFVSPPLKGVRMSGMFMNKAANIGTFQHLIFDEFFYTLFRFNLNISRIENMEIFSGKYRRYRNIVIFNFLRKVDGVEYVHSKYS